MHISAMANAYVRDPRTIAKPGDVVRVKVLEVDAKRRRISLTMRLDQAPEARPAPASSGIAAMGSEKRLPPAASSGDAMTEAFRRAGLVDKPPGRQ